MLSSRRCSNGKLRMLNVGGNACTEISGTSGLGECNTAKHSWEKIPQNASVPEKRHPDLAYRCILPFQRFKEACQHDRCSHSLCSRVYDKSRGFVTRNHMSDSANCIDERQAFLTGMQSANQRRARTADVLMQRQPPSAISVPPAEKSVARAFGRRICGNMRIRLHIQETIRQRMFLHNATREHESLQK